MKVIGITGGIGSGKSTAARITYDLGVKIIDADIIARKITARGKPALTEIHNRFGDEVLNKDGTLNRRKLSNIVFKDKKALDNLNSITHNYIAEEIYKKLNRLRVKVNPEVAVLDVPLPIQKGFMDVVDEIWVVSADKEKRIARLMERSNLSREEANERLHSQMSDEEYLNIADQVIDNNGTPEDLEKQVAGLLMKIKSR